MNKVLTVSVILLTGTVCAQKYGGGSGTAEEPYEIRTAEQMNTIGLNPGDWDKHFKLMNNIDMSVYAGRQYNIIGYPQYRPFTGTFDGNGYVISNLTWEGDYFYGAGVFGAISYATIQNLGIENISLSTWDTFVGGLVGYNDRGTIISCYATGTIRGQTNVGGLVGANYHGTITSCYFIGSVSGVYGSYAVGGLVGNHSGTLTGCYATGDVSGYYCVGGLAGLNIFGIIASCYATGTVSGYYDSNFVGGLVGDNNRDGTIVSCYATGAVSGSGDFVGGLVGGNESGVVTSSFWDIQTSGLTDGVGNIDPDPNDVIGKTTAEMNTRSTFTDAEWDFLGESDNGTEDLWRMCVDGVDYPRLRWEFSRTGDLDCPNGVGLEDLLFLVHRWLWVDCVVLNDCDRADIDGSGRVDLADYALLAGWWLEGGV